MAKASTIIAQLRSTVPFLTNLFTDEVSITSLSRVGTTVTATTSVAHNYTTGQFVTISGAKAPVLVTNLTQVNNIASGTVDLLTPHDLTENNPDHDKITIVGANQSEYNVTNLQIINALNRYQFTYNISGNPVTPATGTILLYDGAERGYNGIFQIIVLSPTTFTYTISGAPYEAPFGTIVSRTGYRISGSISIERAQAAYTREGQNKYWGFVVLGDTTISKDRRVFNDGVTTIRAGSEALRQSEIQQISFYVFVPITNEIAARASRDAMEDLRIILYKCLLRFDAGQDLSDKTPFQLAAVGHKLAEYTNAYFIYEFIFESRNDITDLDCFFPAIDVAFRDIDITILNSPDEPMFLGVNLDDEPFES